MIGVLSDLEVDEERMRRNLDLTEGRTMSEAVMMALAGKGVSRQEAHELVRRLAIRSAVAKTSFKDVLFHEKSVRDLLSEEEIEEALDPRSYLGTSAEQVELAVEKTRGERRERGLK